MRDHIYDKEMSSRTIRSPRRRGPIIHNGLSFIGRSTHIELEFKSLAELKAKMII